MSHVKSVVQVTTDYRTRCGSSTKIKSNSFSIVLKKFYDYVDKHVYSANEATLIRDLCIKLDSGDFSFFNIDELNEMVVVCLFV